MARRFTFSKDQLNAAIPHSNTQPRLRPGPEDSRYEPFPLTDLQQAYWIGRSNGLTGGTGMQLYLELRCHGLDLNRLARALDKLVLRHDMLRCVICDEGLQRVLETVPSMEVPEEDFSALDPEQQAARLADTARSMQEATADLRRWPQSQVRFSRTGGPGQGRLHFKWDMWCFDGRSFQIVIEDLAALYRDPEASLPPLRLRFRDYVLAVEEHVKSKDSERDLAYWRKRLATLPPAPALPRPPSECAVGAEPRGFFTHTRTLSREHTAAIQKSCAHHGLSLTSFMGALYGEVIGLWSGMRRFTLNFPRFNRNLDWHPDVSDMVGEFASFTLLEVDLDSGATFLERAKHLQLRMWTDLEHGSVSGLRLLRERASDMGGLDLQAMPVVFTAMPDRRAVGKNLEQAIATFGEVANSKGETPQVQLDCQYFLLDDSLRVNWDIQQGAYPAGVPNDMFDEYLRLLKWFADDEDAWNATHPASIPARQLCARDRQNVTPLALPDTTVYGLFEARAERFPSKIAVISGVERISYGTLLRHARTIGARIRQALDSGADAPRPGPTPVAGVLLRRGWKQVAAVLGIQAAGLAYLPLDTGAPPARTQSVLAASRPRLVLAEGAFLHTGGGDPTPFVSVDDLLLPAESLPPPRGPVQSDPAYMIFTSGSTGAPKGVTVGHKALLNMVAYTNGRFRIDEDDVFLGVTALHHDLSVFDIFGAMAAGAAMVCLDHDRALDTAHWARMVRAERVSIWNSVPMLMECLLAQKGGEASLPDLRLAILGGDWLDPGIIQRLRAAAPKARLVSIGGPTETTVWNIMHDTADTPDGWDTIPYGRPIDNASYHILTPVLQDAPDWVCGEMYCGGAPLCMSSNTDPTLDALNFVAHPRTGERLYRTGDMGRYRPDGLIEIMGRKDFQLNINGYRLDPAEVENELHRHPDIRRAVVCAVGGRGAEVLGAFLLPGPKGINPRGVRTWLFSRLPVQMQPKALFVVDKFPLTPNGKLDRKALAATPLSRTAQMQEEQRPPANAMELLLAELWEEVLPSPAPGAMSNFFELGGNSLMAMQLMARIEDRLFIRPPLARFFAAPTIAELADALLEQLAGTRRQEEAA
ncbi:amino acid adenylation domain-containing protein [Humidesulfovibrio mexicanus]|uniref:Amino acid adenylation domain-containing protein n=1 Tax=Humidesulfovibrio mexicanus TaxID=147047 RepID=A0A239BJG5_9BACT|nr:non-ribosomal peptide synthetase [Humidesulfovibrio mexicanus]SNS08357.1 amino acid adenylation domain-containing protein [Humidesulfovibrio mexicanus]